MAFLTNCYVSFGKLGFNKNNENIPIGIYVLSVLLSRIAPPILLEFRDFGLTYPLYELTDIIENACYRKASLCKKSLQAQGKRQNPPNAQL